MHHSLDEAGRDDSVLHNEICLAGQVGSAAKDLPAYIASDTKSCPQRRVHQPPPARWPVGRLPLGEAADPAGARLDQPYIEFAPQTLRSVHPKMIGSR